MRRVHSVTTTDAKRQPIPEGVTLRQLQTHDDERGSLTEVFRQAWLEFTPVQWNFVESAENVLRGVHVHLKHADFLVLLRGDMWVGLRDLRPQSPSYGVSTMVAMNGENLSALAIPPGVAHGFYFTVPSLHVYAVSHYWDPTDELGCRWDDPDLELNWPSSSPMISARDAALPSLSALHALLL